MQSSSSSEHYIALPAPQGTTPSSSTSSSSPPPPDLSPIPPSKSTQPPGKSSEQEEKSLAFAEITKANKLGASILVLNDQYYRSVLQQAERSFLWALCAAIVGLLFFLAAVAFLLLRQPQNTSYISVICGALVEAISALNFYLYGRASQQLTAFHLPLERTQRFILANEICNALEESQEETRAKIVLTLVGAPFLPLTKRKGVTEKRDNQTQENELNSKEDAYDDTNEYAYGSDTYYEEH